MPECQHNRKPLSGAQAGIWFAQQLDPENPIYNTAEYVEIKGPLDQELFEKALRHVIKEAESFHARFGEDQDGPWQEIVPSTDFPLHYIDVSSETDPEQAAKSWMMDDLARPVDLTRGPLFTEALFKAAQDHYFWYQRTHHIATDGFSFTLIAERLSKIYTALMQNKSIDQSGAFGSLDLILAEETAYRASEQYQEDRRFWLGRFSDEPEVVSLAERAPRTSSSFLRRSEHLPSEDADRLLSAASRMGATWHETVMAAAAIYVHRLTGANDVVLGMPMMCRLGSAALHIPGMVMNLLPLRIGMQPQMSIGELVKQISGEMMKLRRHQHYRHEELRRDLKLLGENQRLFGPQLNLMPFENRLNFAGCQGIVHNLATGPVDDLSINIYGRPDGGGLKVNMDANPAVYHADELEDHAIVFLLF